MIPYTSSVDYSLDGGNTYKLYDANYTGSISASVFTSLLPVVAPGKLSAVFRIYKSGSVIGSADSNTQLFYAGGTQIKFNSYYTAHEYKYMCVVKRGEFNRTLNPSLYDSSGSQLTFPVVDYDTAGNQIILNMDENFTPYATTIGLYDDANELVAYAKFARPIKVEKDFDSVFIVKFDI